MKEFFEQGDIEKKEGLSVTFLCDRETTNVAKSQISFINNILEPAFKLLGILVPQCKVFINNIKDNIKNWEEIEKKIPKGHKGPKGPEVGTVPIVGTTPKVKQHETFNLDALLACRDAYIKEHGVDQMIVTALLAHQPIIDKDCITFWGDNQLLLEKLKASKAHMEGFFMKYLAQ